MSNIYTKPFIRSNEDWNLFGSVPAEYSSETFCDPLVKGYINSYENYLQDSFIQQVGFDIVAESVFDYPYPYVSEKSIRPLLNKKIFILLAPARTLELLQQYGFKTFSPFIDENYDLIDDPVNRINAVFSEITRLCQLSLDEVKENILQYKDILDYNYQNLWSVDRRSKEKLRELISDTYQRNNR